MSNISQVNTYTKVKQSTDKDSRNFGPLVSGYEPQVSTLNQTVINLSQFVVDLSRKSTVMVYVDGQLLTEGVGNDYVWSAGVNNTSNQLTLAAAIPAGLNIQIYKIGVTQSPIVTADSIQASINLVLNQVDQKNSNKIINGSMEFAQRGASFATVATNAYTLDRWQYGKSGAMVHTISQSTNVPSNAYSPYSLLIDCTTLDAAIAATDFTVALQIIEGNVLQSFKGKSMVLGFKVYATKTGTYCLGLQNGTSTRSLVKEYTVTASNTWQQVYIRFQHDSSGTWNYTTGAGLRVEWTLASGTTYQTTPDTWQNGNFVATSNQVNGCDSTSNDFAITDVVLVEDNATLTKVPGFCYAGRDYAEELQLCNRYYEKSYNLAVNPGTPTPSKDGVFYLICVSTAGNGSATTIFLKSKKRTTPAIAIYAPATGALGNGSSDTDGTNVPVSAAHVGENGFVSYNNASKPVNTYIAAQWTADAEL